MKKLKLRLDVGALQVESFAPSPGRGTAPGTVQGREWTGKETCGELTYCGDTCFCAYTTPRPTCEEYASCEVYTC